MEGACRDTLGRSTWVDRAGAPGIAWSVRRGAVGAGRMVSSRAFPRLGELGAVDTNGGVIGRDVCGTAVIFGLTCVDCGCSAPPADVCALPLDGTNLGEIARLSPLAGGEN